MVQVIGTAAFGCGEGEGSGADGTGLGRASRRLDLPPESSGVPWKSLANTQACDSFFVVVSNDGCNA